MYPPTSAVGAPNTKALQTGEVPVSPPPSKALGQGSPASKALGAGNPELAAWYEQAYSYYNAVMSGQEPMPSQAEWNEFLQWMSWAINELGIGGSWNPMAGQFPQGPQGPGAGMGTEQNYIHDAKEVEVTDTGQGGRHDVWCDEFTLDIPAHSATTTVEYTQEGNPPEDVIKIIVKNQATGQETVYFVHNTEAKIKINAANPNKVTDSTGVVEIGEYVEKGDSSDGTYVEGAREVEEIADNTYEYEGQGNKPITFYSQGNGPDAPDQHHYPFGNSEIVLSNSDKVTVEKVGDEFVVTITHKDGSKDIIHCDPQWHCNFVATLDEGSDWDIVEQITLIDENGQKSHPVVTTDPETGEQTLSMVKPFYNEFSINGFDSTEYGGITAPSSGAAQKTVEEFCEAAGKTEEEVLQALQSAGYEFNSIEDLYSAVLHGDFPPQELDAKFIYFIKYLDETFAEYSQLTWEAANDGNNDLRDQYSQIATDRLLVLLDAFYNGTKNFENYTKEGETLGYNFLVDGQYFYWWFDSDGNLKLKKKEGKPGEDGTWWVDSGDGWEEEGY